MDDETGKDQSNIGNHSDTEKHERRRQSKRRIAPVSPAPSFYEGIEGKREQYTQHDADNVIDPEPDLMLSD